MWDIEDKIKSKMVWVMCMLVALLIYSSGEPSISETNHYCEMVSIYIDSDGENGWPDYNKNYAEVCDEI